MQNLLSLLATFTGLSVPILIFVVAAFLVYLIYGLVSGNGMSLHFGKFSLGLTIGEKKEKAETSTTD